MPSVGTAYVNVRINTKGFEAGLDSVLKKLTGKMEVAGRQLGRSMTSELRSTDWDKGFEGLPKAAGKASTNAVNSLKKVEQKVLDLAITGNDAGNNIARGLDHASRSASDASQELAGVNRAAKSAGNSLNGVGGSGGRAGSGLRSGGDGANFFIKKLRELTNEAERNRKLLNTLFNVAAFGGTAFAGVVGGLSAAAQGIFVVGANAAAAAPALAIMANGMIGLAQIGGTLGIAMQGVGDAIGAGFESAAASVTGVGADTAAASRAIRDAKDALADAYQNAARAAADAARRTADAERALAVAQQATAAAQRELNAARAEALEQLEDIGFAAEDAALSEDRAALSLADARLALMAVSELAPDDRARVEAELAFKEAELNYRQAKDARQDADRDQREAAKKGVEGTEAMQGARENLASAEQAEADAARDLADARREEAEQAADSAEAIADAQQNLADAMQGTGTAMTTAATALDEYQAALDKLGPNQRAFVESIVALRPELEALRRAVGEELFGDLNTALETMVQGGWLDIIQEGLTGTADVLGDLAVEASKVATDPVFESSFAAVMETNNKALMNFGRGGIYLADAFVQVADAARPLLLRFSRWAEDVGLAASETARAKNRTGELGRTIDTAGDRVAEFWGLTKQLWRTLMILGGAANDAANNFGDMGRESAKQKDKFGYIKTLTKSLRDFNRDLEKNPDLIDGFDQALRNLNATGRAFKNVIIDPLITLGQDKNIEEAMTTIADSPAFDRLAATAGDAVPELADLVVSIAEILADLSESGAIEHFLDILSKTADVAEGFVDILADTGILKWTAWITAGYAAVRLLWGGLKIISSPFAPLISGAVNFTKKVNAARKENKGFFGSLGAGFKKDPKDAANARKAGGDVSESFAKGLRSGMDDVERAMEALELKVKTNFTEMTPKLVARATKVGQAIMEGLETGIRTGTVEAKATAFKAGRDVADDIGDGAGTQSPSTITMKDGNDLMEGLELGIKSGTAEAKLAATTAGRSVGNAVGNSAKTAAVTSSAGIGPAMSTSATSSMSKSTGKMSGAMGKMMKPLTGVARGFGGLMRLAMGPFGIALELIFLLLPLLIPLFQKLEEKTGIFSKTLQLVTDALGWVWDKIKDLFGWIKDNWPLLLVILTGPFGLMVLAVIKNWDKIVKFVKDIPDKIEGFLEGLWDFISENATKMWTKVKNIWTKVFTFIKSIPKRFVNGLKRMWDVVTDKLQDAWEWVKSFWEKAVRFGDRIEAMLWGSLKAIWDIVKDKLQDAWDWVQRKWESIKNSISRWPGQIRESLSGLWDGMLNGLATALNWIGHKLNGLIGNLNSVLNKFGVDDIGFTFKTDYAFAKGGPVLGPGTGTSDSIPARLSRGEHVLTAREVQRMGGHRGVLAMRKAALRGEAPLTGQGGIVGWFQDKYNSVKDAIKAGAAAAFKWALSTFRGLVTPADNIIKEVVLGALDWAADKITGTGGDLDEEAAAEAGGYTGPHGKWMNPLGNAAYVVTTWPNSGGHTGGDANAIDMAIGQGAKIFAASAGKVLANTYSGGGYGNYVVIAHAGGESSLYAHMLHKSALRVGQTVKTGSLVGYVDSTGNSTGNHLHFELDPNYSTVEAMRKHGVKLGTGGVVAPSSTGTLALIAESGRSERVTPLDSEGFTPAERRMLEALEKQLGNGGGGDVINVHPSTGMDETALADLVMRRVAWKRRRGSGWR